MVIREISRGETVFPPLKCRMLFHQLLNVSYLFPFELVFTPSIWCFHCEQSETKTDECERGKKRQRQDCSSACFSQTGTEKNVWISVGRRNVLVLFDPIVPKRRYGITILPCVRSQKSEDLVITNLINSAVRKYYEGDQFKEFGFGMGGWSFTRDLQLHIFMYFCSDRNYSDVCTFVTY
jgi:hypothetical protein